MSKRLMTMDGNKAAAYVSYAFTEVASIYPITPSSPMAEHVDEWSSQGKKNLFGQTVKVVEMQSEAGAAGSMHGSLAAGALSTSYTASQGLLLMIPNMYKMAGELLPGVLHVSARALATHALSIFGDHSDVMACTGTGFAMLASSSVQEVMDLAGVAHLAAISSRVPFLHFFDGFRTSHEQQKIEVIEYEDLDRLLDRDAVAAFRARALNPEHPVARGTNQNPDIFFQVREAANPFYARVPEVVEKYMAEISKITGRAYHPFDYVGHPRATRVIVAMGSVCDTAEKVVERLLARGERVGLIKVRLYRPFSAEHFLSVLPSGCRRLTVLDRVKTPGAVGEPLLQDVCAALYPLRRRPVVLGGRYGLGSKDTLPSDILAVFRNMAAGEPKERFTLSITDDVTSLSLPREEELDILPRGTIQCKFWGLGSDGTVGANKQAVDIIGRNPEYYAQAYFDYDSKKSGGLTVSHLRFGKEPIKAPYLIHTADFISCSNKAYVSCYDVLRGLKSGGTFLLNCSWIPAELDEYLPASMRRYIAKNKIKFYIINAAAIARELGLGNRTNMIMQAAFFKLSRIMPLADAALALKDAIRRTYGAKGEKIVLMNEMAVDAGFKALVKVRVPAEWAEAEDAPQKAEPAEHPEFVERFIRPMNRQEGNELPVSTFSGVEDGTFDLGGSRFEKRGVASYIPAWLPDNCIQCNRCSFVCPHAAIRPILLSKEEAAAAPAEFKTLAAQGRAFSGLRYRMQLSPLDCLGCGVCVEVCPAKEKALEMQDFDRVRPAEEGNWEYAMQVPSKQDLVKPNNVKNSQFYPPYLEFSGSCAGCSETAYTRLVTQLFGNRMMIANATGCSSIWGAAVPAIPFCKDAEGKGPAWCNSLFEDNAEFGLGMNSGVDQLSRRLLDLAKDAAEDEKLPAETRDALIAWSGNFYSAEGSKEAAAQLLPLLAASKDPRLVEMYEKRDFLIKKSFWILGGDGWAYDIGYGGLDHVLASGDDVNILVFDTEVYSNTGGQASKATPTGAVAKFAAAGKPQQKKDLGMMAISYGYVYVAQIAMGADMTQTLKAIREAEAYPGPSLIIAYSPCVNHGLKKGMNRAMTEMDLAVKCGYWQLFRFDPRRRLEGHNPFQLDSGEPEGGFREFLLGEVRYNSLRIINPEAADAMFAQAEEQALARYAGYKAMAESAGGKGK